MLRSTLIELSRRGIGCILLATFSCVQALAQHAPTTYIAVSNDGVSTDRFSDPEAAARTSIDRANAQWGTPTNYYIFDRIEHYSDFYVQQWIIYYYHQRPNAPAGPYQWGSAAIRFFVCDATPKIGPNFGAHEQGLPKVVTRYPNKYANGCPAPQVDIDKNPCQSNCESNPINVGMMTKIQVEKDYSANGASDSLHFERLYNSLGFTADAMLPYTTLGSRWRHNFDRSVVLYEYPTKATAAVLRPNGTILKFTLTSGVWTPDADVADKLQRLTDGGGNPTGWSFTTAANDVETYDVSGRLALIAFRNGNTQTLTYSTTGTSPAIAPVPGLLIDVTDNFGRSLQFAYDAQKRIQSFTDPAGNAYGFTYDSSNNLASVTRPGSAARTYVYGELSLTQNVQRKNHLTGIVDENGSRFSSYGYDNWGRAISSSRSNGLALTTVAYTLDTGGNVTSAAVTDPLGFTRSKQFVFRRAVVKRSAEVENTATTALSYDTNGNLTRSVDKNGNSSCFAFDVTRNIESVRVEGFASTVVSCPANLASYTPAPGTRERKFVTAWHGTFRLPTSVTEANRTTSFTHDASGNVLTRTVTDTSVTPSASRTWTYTHNSFGQVLTEDGPRTDVSDITTYAYYTCTTGYQCGQIYAITNALGHTTTYNSYNAHGQPTQITDANGLVTSLAYDLRQRLTDRCVGGALPACSGGELTHLDYWPTGLLKKVTNPDGSYIEYIYDAAHRLTEIKDGALNRIVYTLDNAGNRTAENTYDPSNALRRTHSRIYNTLGQLWKDVNAAGTANVTTVFGYDNNGNQTTTNAPLSRNSTSLYDELNRLKQITDPASGVTQFGYNANDNLTSVTDPRSLVTNYAYNGLGELTTQTSPDTGVTTNTYDSAGNLDTSTDSRGVVTDYSYDVANRVTSASFTLGSVTDQTINYGYDAGTNQNGLLTSAWDADHSLAWTYDAHGRVTGKGQTVGSTTLALGYGYNAAGQLGNVTLPSGNVVTFGYNANGQVSSLTLNGSTTILNNIAYDPFGPITGWSWGNGTTASRGFDTDGKLTQVDNANGASLKNYAYDDAFRITGITDAGNSALSWTYGYDSLDRLNSASSSSITQGWTYDANGNRLTESGTTPSTYTNSGTSNRVNSISASLPRTYGYDAAGNSLSFGTATFTYNNRGRMATASNAGTTATYTYNALGQRIKRATSSISTMYVYDEAGHLAGEYTAAGALIQETVWLGDTPVATLRPNGSGGVNLFYVHADHLNTPRLVTDSSNNIRWSWESDAFGTTVPNENPSGLGVLEYHLRFPGQQYDAVVGLHYNYRRDYDAGTGRYTESDPIGLQAGINTYGYVVADPVSRSDEFGLCDKKICGLKKGPEFDHSGEVLANTRISVEAEFLNDEKHDPMCCEVRQHILWNKCWSAAECNFLTYNYGLKPGVWHEDRGPDGYRARRDGQYFYDKPDPSNQYTGNKYHGEDMPGGPANPGFFLKLRPLVVDRCRGGMTIYTGKTLKVVF
jgi:RHS repeat-associated protein